MTDNELISRFMGRKYVEAYLHAHPFKEALITKDSLEYHSSWDWLMPVVQKINYLHDKNFVYDAKEIIEGNWPIDDEYMQVVALPMSTPIDETYKAVVGFIKWYNTQTQTA